jgi:hypothetical protein
MEAVSTMLLEGALLAALVALATEAAGPAPICGEAAVAPGFAVSTKIPDASTTAGQTIFHWTRITKDLDSGTAAESYLSWLNAVISLAA